MDLSGCSIFHWGIPPSPRVFLGAGILGGEFLAGPTELGPGAASIQMGTCCTLTRVDDRLLIEADPQGQYPLYRGPDFVTNRLHLAAHVVRSVDPVRAVSTYFNNRLIMWDQPAQDATPVEGVDLLAPGTAVEVGGGAIGVRAPEAAVLNDVIGPEEYWTLIDRAASEICSNVQSIVDSDYPVLCDLSGGQDSRILLGALVALDRVGDVAFNTNRTPNKLGDKDLAIGSGLVKAFGGTYEFRNDVSGYAELGFEAAWALRRSQLFGNYHFVPPTFVAPGIFERDRDFVRMGGACGEIYRDAFPSFLSLSDKNEVAHSERAREIFRSKLWPGMAREFCDDVVSAAAAAFCSLDGSTLQQKLNSHHLMFRSRFHFAYKLSIRGSGRSVSAGPLYSSSLLAAARGLPEPERASGRAVFDVTKTLCESLPYYPYDKPNEHRYADSAYHRASTYDGTTLAVPDGLDLIEAGKTPVDVRVSQSTGSPKRPFRTEAEFFDEVLADCARFFRGRSDWSRFLGGEEMTSLVDDYQDNRVGRLRMASKLQFTKDLLEVCDP